jgi:hypothetical protein
MILSNTNFVHLRCIIQRGYKPGTSQADARGYDCFIYRKTYLQLIGVKFDDSELYEIFPNCSVTEETIHLPEVGKVTLKSNGNEALSDESL